MTSDNIVENDTNIFQKMKKNLAEYRKKHYKMRKKAPL